MCRFLVNFTIINTLVQGINNINNIHKIKYIRSLKPKRSKTPINISIDNLFWLFFGKYAQESSRNQRNRYSRTYHVRDIIQWSKHCQSRGCRHEMQEHVCYFLWVCTRFRYRLIGCIVQISGKGSKKSNFVNLSVLVDGEVTGRDIRWKFTFPRFMDQQHSSSGFRQQCMTTMILPIIQKKCPRPD